MLLIRPKRQETLKDRICEANETELNVAEKTAPSTGSVHCPRERASGHPRGGLGAVRGPGCDWALHCRHLGESLASSPRVQAGTEQH